MRRAPKLIIAIMLVMTFQLLPAQAQVPQVDFQLDFMQWAVYTVPDWTNNENLWTITITTDEPDMVRGLILEMFIFVAGSPSGISGEIGWAYSWGDSVSSAQPLIYRNDDYFREQVVAYDEYSTAFEDEVMATGSSLPAGEYTYHFLLWYDEEWATGQVGGIYANLDRAKSTGHLLDEDQEMVTITQPASPELQQPGEATEEGLSIMDQNPSFYWLTTGASNGSVMFFRIVICEKEELQSNDEAIQNLPFFEITWEEALPFTETGITVPYFPTFSYPTTAEDLSAGNRYVWQVTVRSERHMQTSSTGFIGESEIFCFQYGESPEPTIPGRDTEVTNVNQNFAWTSALGANQGYQIRLSGEDDPTVENDYFEEDVATNSLENPPEDEVLVPGRNYFWKVRALPEGAWCEPSPFNMQQIELINPSFAGEENTVRPSFTINAPQGIGSYEFQIAGIDDPDLNSPSIFESPITSYDYTTTEELPLQPGQTYFWRAIPISQEGDIIGELEDYLEISNFTVEDISIINPDEGGTETSLAPNFSWSSPLGVESWELQIRDDINQGVQSEITATSFIYPADAELPLIPGQSYYWRILPVMDGSIVGEVEDYPEHAFSVSPLLLTDPPNTEVISSLNPNFMWDGPDLCPGDKYEFQISTVDDPEVSNPAYTHQPPDMSFIYPADADLELLPDQTYYWTTKVYSQEHGLIGEPENYPVSSFTIQFTGELNLNVQVPSNSPLLPQFSWSSIPEASSYLLSICNTPDDFDSFYEVGGLNGTNYNYTDSDDQLLYNTPYYAKIKALQGSTVIMQSEFEEFTCEISGPGLNVTVSENDPLHPVFDWNTVPGASNYHIYVGSTVDINNYFWDEVSNLTGLSYPLDAPQPLEFGSTYFAWLQAQDSNGDPYGPMSSIVSFSIAAVDYEFTVTVPDNSPLNPIFNWSTIPSSAYYGLNLSLFADVSAPFFEGQVQGVTYTYSAADPSLLMDQTYYAQVQAYDSGDNALGDPSNIEMVITPGIEYGLTYQLLENLPLNPLFSWALVPGAYSYYFVLAEGSDITNIYFDQIVAGTSLSYPLDAPALNFSTFYLCLIQALNASGEPIGGPSAPLGFSTPLTPEVELSYPPTGEIITENTPLFQWTPENYIDYYQIEAALSDNMENPFWSDQVQGGSILYPGDEELQYGATYYWHVTGYGPSDQLLAASAVSHFSIHSFIPELSTPGSGDPVQTLTPSFSWTSGGANGVTPSEYHFMLGNDVQLQAPFFETTIQVTNFTYPASALPLSYSSTYFWGVTAINGDGSAMGPMSQVFSFTTPVGGPSLVSPVNTSVSSLMPDFVWNELAGAGEYGIEVYSDEGLNNQLWAALLAGTQTLYGGPDLAYESTYYWFVQAYNAGGQIYGQPSETAFFVTPSIGSPSLISPVNGVTVEDANPNFNWSGIEGVLGYSVEISDASGVINTIQSSATSVQYPGSPDLAWDTDYSWRVWGTNAVGAQVGGFSETGNFHTPGFTAPGITAPVGEVTSNRPQFQWEELTGSAGYQVQVASDDGFANLLWDAQVSATTTNYGGDDPLAYNQQYHWHIRGLDSEGAFLGQWSDIGAFTPVPASIVSPTAPIGEIYTLTPTFEWGAVAGASKYGLWLYSDQELTTLLWSTMQVTGTSAGYPGQGVTPLDYGSSYWWQAVALDNDGNPLGDPSEIVSFSVSGANLPVLTYPINNVVLTDFTTGFSWQGTPGAQGYQIQVATNAVFSSVLVDVVAAGSYVAFSGVILEFDETYWWRVMSLNAAGEPLSDFSEPGEFTTPSGEMIVELLFGP